MIALMLAIFYFMLIRPENKRKKEAENMRSNLKKGDRIITIGGIMGRIVQVNDTSIVIETSDDRVRMEIAKWGVQTTEAMMQASAQQKSGGLFGKKAAKEPKADEGETPEPAEKDDKSSFDPEIK